MKTTMRVIIFSFLMLGLVSGQDLPQPAIVGEDLIQPTLKISEFVKVDENTGIKDDRVTLGIRQLLEESFSNSRYILVEDDNANFVVSAEVVYIGRPNEAFSIVGLFNRRNSKTQVNMVISIKDNQTGKTFSFNTFKNYINNNAESFGIEGYRDAMKPYRQKYFINEIPNLRNNLNAANIKFAENRLTMTMTIINVKYSDFNNAVNEIHHTGFEILN